MKFGVCVPNYGESLSVDGLRAVGIEAEKLGYDSIWTTDHILMPKNSGTPYEQIFDCIASLAYLAPLTSKVKLGISSLIIGMRNPIAVAKQLASIDAFTGGRVLVAMASGWNEMEFSFVGADYHTRGKKLDESIRLFRDLWKGETEFHGKALSVNFENAVFEPRPKHQLSILIGGQSEAAMRRAVTIGDAWHPNVFPLDTFRKLVAQFRQISPLAKDKEICVRIGLNTTAMESEYVGATGEKRILFSGNMSRNHELLSELEGLGVSSAVLVPNTDGKISIENQLQSIRDFAREFLK
jgi:alkanesulfonate monooxygenase SsuD/methylene tetrahydromethanopterin reductase-like flavin-dependent oxidoreductase (luciferase family)